MFQTRWRLCETDRRVPRRVLRFVQSAALCGALLCVSPIFHRDVSAQVGAPRVMTLNASGSARAGATAMLRVQRNIFRRGGWGFVWRSPDPYGYGDARVGLPSPELPRGANVSSAVLSWHFGSVTANTYSNRPMPYSELGGNHAKAPRVYGSSSYCGPCSPATINRWAPDAAYFASRIDSASGSTHRLPGTINVASGSVDLVPIFGADEILRHPITFVGTARYSSGRPYFATEGWNATTEFDVSGSAEVAVSVTLTITYTIPETFSISGNTGVGGVTVSAGGRTTTSGDDGAYVIAGLSTGTYVVTAVRNGCSIAPPAQSVSVGPDAVVNFQAVCGEPRWRISSIPGAPPGFAINGMWARNRNEAYAWGDRQLSGAALRESYLFKWNGLDWIDAFYLPNAQAVSVFGTGASEVWISAFFGPTGPSVVYRSVDNGTSWSLQQLPAELGNSWVGNLAGTPGNIHASGGPNRILRFADDKWDLISAGGTRNNDSPGPMAFTGPNEGVFVTCWGYGVWNGSDWRFTDNPWDFCDVSALAVSRSGAQFAMKAAGNNNFSNGVRIWGFDGRSFGSKCGFEYGDPVNGTFICGGVYAGNGSYGRATGIASISPTDFVAVGSLGYPKAGGRIYRFRNGAWTDVSAIVARDTGAPIPAATAVFTTAADDIWVGLADGRVLRYSPDAVARRPSFIAETTTPLRIYTRGAALAPSSRIDAHPLIPLLGERVFAASAHDSASRLNSYAFGFRTAAGGRHPRGR